jgi:hypothetical protein
MVNKCCFKKLTIWLGYGFWRETNLRVGRLV